MANTNTPSKSNNALRWITINDLGVVQRNAQRPVNEAWVAQLVRNFDPEAVGVITVAERNGSDQYHIIDGQHRVEALKRLGLGAKQIPCLVKATHEVQDEARWFLKHNTSKGVSAVDRFRVAVTAGEPTAVAINKVLKSHGLTVGCDPRNTVFAAVAAAETVANRYGVETFDATLDVVTATWPEDRNALHGAIVQGVAQVIVLGADLERLVAVLAKTSGPLTLIGYAKSRRDVYRGTLPHNVAGVIVERYNIGLRSNRLDLDAKAAR